MSRTEGEIVMKISRSLIIAASLAAFACSSQANDGNSSTSDLGPDVSNNEDAGTVGDQGQPPMTDMRPVEDLHTADTTSDTSPDAAANVEPPTVLPLAEDAITPVGVGAGIDIYSEIHGDMIVFEHYDEAFTRGELRTADLSELAQPPVTLDLEVPEEMVGSPSIPTLDGISTLYIVATASSTATARVERRPWTGLTPGVAEDVTMPERIRLVSWPRFMALADERLAVAYRDEASVVKLGFSDDGLTFGAPQVMGPAGAQPELAQMADGSLVYTYQVGFGADIQSYLRLSADGIAWTEAALVTESSTNVHDTEAFVRADGRVDLYYIWPDSAIGFDLWRRCVSPEGELGPEELVVETSWGNLAKPRAHRRPDGAIRLTFVDQNRGHRLFTARLVGDAPCD